MKERKYNFYRSGNTVICTTTLGPHKFRATAKCSPEDEFDIVVGQTLAQARVDLKIAEYRYRQAIENEDHIDEVLRKYSKLRRDAALKVGDRWEDRHSAHVILNKLEQEL